MSEIVLTDAQGRAQVRTRRLQIGGVALDVPEDPRYGHQVDLAAIAQLAGEEPGVGYRMDGEAARQAAWATVGDLGGTINAAARIIDGLCRELDQQRARVDQLVDEVALLKGEIEA